MRPGPHRSPSAGGDHGPPAVHTPLTVLVRPQLPQAAVVLLHGGRADGLAPPPRVDLPALRMRPFSTAIRRRLAGHQVLVAAVRYRHRGWNGPCAHPAYDAHHALGELAGIAPHMPVVLVGHSMGARAALRAAGDPVVRGVVALAPWCPTDEPVAHLRGRTIAVLHDPGDRITQARDSWEFAERARTAGARVRTVLMPSGGHAMLRGARHWHRSAADFVAGILGVAGLPDSSRPPDR